MPPAISDDEMESDSGPDDIPAKGKIPTKADEAAADNDDDEEGSDDDEAEEYRVEKILKHDFDKDETPLYQIKWLGYNKKADLTWEPLDNLENAMDLVNAYHVSIGGPPIYDPSASKPKKSKGGSASKRSAPASPTVESNAKKSRSRKSDTNGNVERTLPTGSWESNVLRIQSIVEEAVDGPQAKGSSGKVLKGMLEWLDGRKTVHPLATLRTKCPQKLLDYYEQHLKFNDADN